MDGRARYKIQAWWQPDGPGHGWAQCHGNLKDETVRWIIYRSDTKEIIGWKKTQLLARLHAKRLNEEKTREADWLTLWLNQEGRRP